jgi:nucleoside 2-deoxyribosyltransferase
VEKCGFTALRIDEVENAGSITEQTLQQIERSAVVLADLSGERPNCYFEAGYAHALGKQLILSIRKGETRHFDLADRRFIEWETEKELFDGLTRRLESIRASMPAPARPPAPGSRN